MAVNSNINPNFPLPGIDQSSRGFRDNFSYAKQEIENLQSKQIQLYGDVVSDAITIDSGSGVVAINTQVLFHSVTVSGNQYGVLFNNSGIITTSTLYYDPATQNLGIGTSVPRESLDVYSGNIVLGNNTTGVVQIMTETATDLALGTNGSQIIYMNQVGMLGINMLPSRTLDVTGGEYDVARFTSTLASTDAAVRLRTAQTNSSVGWVVENENTYAGGIRADNNGFVSLHAGENPGSGLQNGSRALTINPVNQFVGVGTSSPTARLDVAGNLHVSGTITSSGIGAPTLLGSRSDNTALTNLIVLLSAAGLIVDGTTA